uniref:Uncharacterized protein n=1 Tax=Glossina austeni TaxID=7395 RepID=A0A1A9VMK6_GLOAU
MMLHIYDCSNDFFPLINCVLRLDPKVKTPDIQILAAFKEDFINSPLGSTEMVNVLMETIAQPCQFSSKPGVTVLALAYHFATLGYLLKSKPATSKLLTVANKAMSATVNVSPAAYCWPSKKTIIARDSHIEKSPSTKVGIEKELIQVMEKFLRYDIADDDIDDNDGVDIP